MKKFALLGKSLKHSISPKIHSHLGEYSYKLIEVSQLDSSAFCGLDGFNVTIPYKSDIIKYLDKVDNIAKICDSVNTVVNENGMLVGYNTDIYGIEMSFKKAGIDISNKNVLILGSGGTAKTLSVFAAQNNSNIYISSRNSTTKNEIISNINVNFKCINIKTFTQEFDEIDIILNATPQGLYPNIYEKPIELNKFKNLVAVFDPIYNPLNTKLLLSAKKRGITAIGGLDMLIYQAIKASQLWGVCESFDISSIISDAKNYLVDNFKFNIILIGFMGCGKTTIGKMLASKLSMNFIDTDYEIEKTEGIKISDIFSSKGEEYFREIETLILKSTLNTDNVQVISTGGGILEKNKDIILNANGFIIFLDTPFSEIENRLSLDTSRPLFDKSTAFALYNKRLAVYNDVCDFKINCLNKDEIVDKIFEILF